MTTFKNNAKYAELIFTYLDVAVRNDTPLTVQDVLTRFRWMFKGGALRDASKGTRLEPETSAHTYPHGFTEDILKQWPSGREAQALHEILSERRKQGRLRNRGVMARLGSYLMMTSTYGNVLKEMHIYSGMRAIYVMFGLVWDWAKAVKPTSNWDTLGEFTREMVIGSSQVSRMHVPTTAKSEEEYWDILTTSRVPGLIQAACQAKDLIRVANGATARNLAKGAGLSERERWGEDLIPGTLAEIKMRDMKGETRYLTIKLGPMSLRVSQGCAMWGDGEVRHALGKSDMERLHQLIMSSASALVGVCAQSIVGTVDQRRKARSAVGIAVGNIQRIVTSSRKVPLGDEVLVCKAYRRAYTAHLGWLAGPLCRNETEELIKEAEETARPGVIDVDGFLFDVRSLDAASSLNAAKMFKICPAPDVSPGTAMMDRVKQIGDGNVVDASIMPMFEEELRTQILRAYIRSTTGRLKLRDGVNAPTWHRDYLQGNFNEVPSSEINTFLAWEGTAKMPDVSPYDPSHWKDSGLGADTIYQATNRPNLGYRGNMITRLIFDEECPMPGSTMLNPEHVIKFFVKAEGHKDPARGIFSANLRDRQAQSWMERAVEQVAKQHPSYMIGQEIDVREARVTQLTSAPEQPGWIPLYYSFDISGWSAKMPGEPQRISHNIWADLYGGHLFEKATEINEGAHIYLNIEGYLGWYKNTHSNLEGFNGKEMTMVLIALLSLSVRRWRSLVVEQEILTEEMASRTSALLFAYIDDGLSRIDLPRGPAIAAFTLYKTTVIDTFSKCGFSVEVSKCFPSDRFSIFLNEVYLAGRHVVHGVRAAMGISAEPTERHTSLPERTMSVATGCRGAVMAGLNPLSATMLMAYHLFLHLIEWTTERDPVVLAVWCLMPRTWGGLGIPNMLQLYVSGSGSAFEEGIATIQAYARLSVVAKKAFLYMSRHRLSERDAVAVLTGPLSGRVDEGYMVDNRVAIAVRRGLQDAMEDGRLSPYATRLLRYADMANFRTYAEAVIPVGELEVLQEQMINNVAEAHPHTIFSAFAMRLEKSMTVLAVVGRELFVDMMNKNRAEAQSSALTMRWRSLY